MYTYKESKQFSPHEYFKEDKVEAFRVKHAIDPIKRNGLRLSSYENAGCLFQDQEEDSDERFKRLFEGKQLYLSAGPKIKQSDGTMKSTLVIE